MACHVLRETMARRKRGRDIDGIVLLDKPVGCSSNAVLQRARRAFDARKAGHTGSLDPLASGLLPLCFGEATKLSSYLLTADKHYRVTAIAGSETDTGDAEGRVVYRDDSALDRATLCAALERYIGAQRQIPPMYSALKHQGKRLYEHARAGREVERKPRAIHIRWLRLIDIDASGFTLEACVSGGTYMRTLIADIARDCGGAAHVGALRRLRVGALGQALAMTPLAEVEARAARGEDLTGLLRPLSMVVAGWPSVLLKARSIEALRHGQSVTAEHAPACDDGRLCLTAADGRFFGLGRIDDHGRIAPKRLFVRPQR